MLHLQKQQIYLGKKVLYNQVELVWHFSVGALSPQVPICREQKLRGFIYCPCSDGVELDDL